MTSDVLRIGRVVEVNGSRVLGELEAQVDDLYRTYRSRRYPIGQVGSIVKIDLGDSFVFGVVTALRMAESPGEPPVSTFRQSSAASKWIEIELLGHAEFTGVGEADFEFERGLSAYPLPGQPISICTTDELHRVYAKPNRPTLQVGRLSQATALPVHLIMDELLAKHFAVLGTTGSGKSCAVALLISAIIDQYPNAHIVLLDPHGEYAAAFPDRAILIDPTNLELPHWLLNLEESIELFIGRTERAATVQATILKDSLLQARKAFLGEAACPDLTADTPVPYRIGDLLNAINSSKPSQASQQEPWKKLTEKVEALQRDKRFEFLIRPDHLVQDNLPNLLSDMLRIPPRGKPLAIIDLSGVPSDVTGVVVSVLCRMIFDFCLWNPLPRSIPLLLICEEAHRYAPKSDDAVFRASRQALSTIAKEGRKYGVALALVSQRPSELDPTILSQCNTIIALRMTNEEDQRFVRNALPDSVRSLVEALPALRTREALVFGEGTAIPLRMLFDELPSSRMPRSNSACFSASWKGREERLDSIVRETVRRWRAQERSARYEFWPEVPGVDQAAASSEGGSSS